MISSPRCCSPCSGTLYPSAAWNLFEDGNPRFFKSSKRVAHITIQTEHAYFIRRLGVMNIMAYQQNMIVQLHAYDCVGSTNSFDPFINSLCRNTSYLTWMVKPPDFTIIASIIFLLLAAVRAYYLHRSSIKVIRNSLGAFKLASLACTSASGLHADLIDRQQPRFLRCLKQ